MSNIFISYRHVEPDQTLARSIEQRFTACHHKVFIDTQMLVGTKWAAEIERRLKAAEFFIVLISKDSIRSDMLRREVEMAHEIVNSPNGGLSILPVRVNFLGELPYDLGSYLKPIQYTTWDGSEDDDKVLNELTLAVEKAAALPMAGSDPDNDDGNECIEGLYASTEKIGAPLPVSDPRLAPDLRMDTGAVRSTSPFYVARESDGWLLGQITMKGSTSIIKGARQTGKSSLLARAHNTTKKEGHKSIYLDFQSLDGKALKDLDSLCRYIAKKIIRDLQINVKPSDTWDENLGAKDNLTDFFEHVILTGAETRILLLIDEADRIFDYAYRDDFFGLIRAWHNRRSFEEVWDKVNLVIAHATEPYLWIQNINQSPFNVGERYTLEDFTVHHIEQLNQRHGCPLNGTQEIEALYELVGGRPYLVRQALFSMVSRRLPLSKLEAESVDERGPFGDHLRWYIWCLNRHRDLMKALKQILRENRCVHEIDFLKLSATGLIKGRTRQNVHMRCRLYRNYFGIHL